MANHDLTLNLARLVVAAAWADGKLEHDELNSLKDLLFNLPDLWEEDWQRLKLYMETPVEADEAERLLTNVVDSIRSGKDRDFVLATLNHLVHSDGEATAAENQFVEEVSKAIAKRSGVMGGLKGLLKSVIGRRSATVKGAPNREDHFEDYIRNEVYHGVVHVDGKDTPISIPDEKLRKLCIAAGLMAWIAHNDNVIETEEQDAIRDALKDSWQLPPNEASLVAEVSCKKAVKGLDFSRLCREFFEITTHEERGAFLKCLFQIANAAGRTSHDEIERIREVSDHLKIDHRDFIAAKLTISKEDRAGL